MAVSPLPSTDRSTAPALQPGDSAVTTRTITDSWTGPIPAGTRVTVVEFEAEHVAPEDYAAELPDGSVVSFKTADLTPADCDTCDAKAPRTVADHDPYCSEIVGANEPDLDIDATFAAIRAEGLFPS